MLMKLSYRMGSRYLHYLMFRIYIHIKLMKQEQKVMINWRSSGRSRCQLQRSHRWNRYWINEWVRRPEGKNTSNIWSSGRAIQLKMPAGKMKQRFRSMEIPCESSWIGAHKKFQAREYDAGASPTSSERGTNTNTFWHI